jgi:hypothetical protein
MEEVEAFLVMGNVIHKRRDVATGVPFRPLYFYYVCTQVGEQLCTVSALAICEI